MILVVVVAFTLLAFMMWQLIRAKQFTRFKSRIHQELKPQVINFIKEELGNNRSELYPNTPCHIDASILFWTASAARIMQYALEKEIVDQQALKEAGDYRHCQHLFHIEREYLLPQERITGQVIARIEEKE